MHIFNVTPAGRAAECKYLYNQSKHLLDLLVQLRAGKAAPRDFLTDTLPRWTDVLEFSNGNAARVLRVQRKRFDALAGGAYHAH